MKKIAVFSNMYPSKDHPTFGIFVKNQVEQLRSAKVDVDVIAIDEPGKGKVKTLQKYLLWFVRSFLYMMKNRKKLTLTHAHYAFPTGFISWLGKKFMGIPYVVTVHGGDIDKMAKKNETIAKLTSKILTEADTVIVVGEKLRENVIERFGVQENRVQVMSMGVNTSVFKREAKSVARESLGLQQEGRIILFVGNVIRAKGVLELLKAFQSVKETDPECTLYVIGSQRDHSFLGELQSFIREEKLEDIYFKNPLSQVDLAHWMSATDVLALPSHHEGFGLVALEAMAAGAKVVGTDVGGLTYLLKDGAGILVRPENPVSLAEGLKDALDPESISIDESVVHDRVSANSFDTILNKVLAIYRTVGKDQGKLNE